MKMTFTSMLCYVLFASTLLISCKKNNPEEDQAAVCSALANVHTHTFTPVTTGQQITIAVDSFPGAFYSWTGPGNYQSYDQNSFVSSNASYSNEGWYFVLIQVDGCSSVVDSVYVDVKFPQGTPSCTPVNNTATFGGGVALSDQSFSASDFGPSTSGYGATFNSSAGDLTFALSSYWREHDLEDGIYYTTNDPLPDYADIDKVFISDVNQSIYWVAAGGKPVYLSHVGGKARLTFCGVDFTGTFGSTLYHTSVSAQLTDR